MRTYFAVLLGAATLFAPFASAQTNSLSYKPIAAEYSKSVDRIIMVSASPDQLHIYDPVANVDSAVSLSKTPTSVSVSPDGNFAAVGHDQLVTYVNLTTATVVQTFPISVTANQVVLSSTFIYVPPTISIEIGTGTVTTRSDAVPSTGARLLASANVIFSTRTGSNPNDIDRFDVGSGAISGRSDSPYNGQFDICGKIFLSLDAARVFNSCGTIFRTSDLKFNGTFPNIGHIAGLAESGAFGRMAVVPDPSTAGQSDSEIRYIDSYTLRQFGRFAVSDVSSGGKTGVGHSRWVFFSANGTMLYSVNQADASAGITNDFAVQRLSLFNFDPNVAPTCTVTPGASSVSSPGFGSYNAISVTAAADCLYGVATSDAWIQVVTGNTMSGNGTISILTRPNTGGARSGSVLIGTQAVTINQDAAPAVSAFTRLPYRIVDAEFAKAIDRIIFVSANPDELHIYNGSTGADQIVALPAPPTSVSVRPDGRLAAVGHSGYMSQVDLGAGVMYSNLYVPTIVKDIVLASNGYAYLSGPNDQADFGAVQLTFGNFIPGNATLGNYMRLNAGGNLVYLGTGTPSRLNLVPIPFTLESLPAAGNACGGIFPTEDGAKIFTGCGEVRSTSVSAASDLTLAGSLSALGTGKGILSATDSSVRRTTVVVPNTVGSTVGANEVQAYADDSLNFTGRITLPGFSVGSTNYNGQGRFVFWNGDATKLFVLETAETAANLSSPWGVYTIGAGTLADGCTLTLNSASVNFQFTGGSQSVGVSIGANCAYVASSNASWITVTSGGFGIGSGSVQLTAAPAVSTTPRSGTVTIGNQTLNVTQDGIQVTITLSPTSASAVAAGGPGGFTVTPSSGSFAWTATSNAPWITITSGASGTGTGAVGYSVLANASSNPRTGTITAGGQVFTINQAGVPATIVINPTAANVGANGGSGSITVTITPSDYNWTATSNAAWLSVNTGFNGTGSGIVTWSAAGNPTLSARSGTLTVAGQTFTVNQAAGSPSLSFAPGFAFFTAVGGSSTFQVFTTPGAFVWNATADAAWITITAGASGNGAGQVSYTVLPNTGASRSSSITINGQQFVISQSGVTSAGATGLRFVPVTPCRIADTRNAVGPFGGPSLATNGTRSFVIPDSSCGIPASAAAYSLNVTVVPAGPLSYLTMYPTGGTQPLVSTLNSADGRVKANAAIVPAGTGGAVSVFASNPTDVILDINGYFTADTTVTTALQFYPLTPCRLVDTRGANAALAGPKMTAGQSRTFPLQSSACGLPANAKAYSLNMTVVPTGPLSYLTTWPTGSSKPLVSTLNAPTGTIVANAAIVPAGTSGSVDVYVTDATDVIIDVNGYFAPPSSTGLSFYTVTPCRVADTRNANGPFGGPSMTANSTRDFAMPFSTCGLPSTAQAFSLNATVVPSVPLGYLTLWPTTSAQPVVSTLNAPDGSVTANAAIVPAGINGAISAFVTHQTDLILDVNGYFAP